jgi:hypothetical protein
MVYLLRPLDTIGGKWICLTNCLAVCNPYACPPFG